MKYTYLTNSKKILGDLYTPVSAYLKIRDLFPQSALMESSDYHGGENGRSFIGVEPIANVSGGHGTASIPTAQSSSTRSVVTTLSTWR